MTVQDNIRIPRPLAVAIGFLLTFNVYLLPWSAQTPRATDVIGATFLVIVVALLLMGLRLSQRSGARILVVAILLFPMFWHGLLIGQLNALIDAFRWVIGFGWALGLTWMARNNRLRSAVFKGFIIGTVGCVGVIIMQAIGLIELTVSLGWAPQDAVVGAFFAGILRVPGVEANVNGSAAVFSFCVPVALGLLNEGRAGRIWFLIAVATVTLGSAITFNRSSMLVSGVTIAAWMFSSGQKSVRTRWKVLTVLIIIGGFVTFGPPGGWERWDELSNLGQSGNFRVRSISTLFGLDLLYQNPLGTGKVYQTYIENYMRSKMEHGTTHSPHNALIQLGLMAGIPLVIWVIWKLGIRAVSLFRRGSVESLLSLHLLGLFFFEAYFAVPTVISLTAWLAIQPLAHRSFSNAN